MQGRLCGEDDQCSPFHALRCSHTRFNDCAASPASPTWTAGGNSSGRP